MDSDAGVAARMWTLTDIGFTPGYSLTFVGPSGIELRVSLQVYEIC